VKVFVSLSQDCAGNEKERRAGYGEEIIVTVSQKLVLLYGKGFDVKNLWRMIQFAERFSAEGIIVTLSRQLSWSHFVAILPVEDQLAREFYAEMCRLEHWSVRTFEQIALLELSKSGIRVAQYLTQLPPRKILEEKLHEAIRLARMGLEHRRLLEDNK